VGQDANGRDLTSLVVERFDGDAPKANKTWPPSLRVFRTALVEAVLSSGFDYKIPSGPTVKAVDLNRVRDAFYKTYVVESDEDTTNRTAARFQAPRVYPCPGQGAGPDADRGAGGGHQADCLVRFPLGRGRYADLA